MPVPLVKKATDVYVFDYVVFQVVTLPLKNILIVFHTNVKHQLRPFIEFVPHCFSSYERFAVCQTINKATTKPKARLQTHTLTTPTRLWKCRKMTPLIFSQKLNLQETYVRIFAYGRLTHFCVEVKMNRPQALILRT